jgi:hypothetical protein
MLKKSAPPPAGNFLISHFLSRQTQELTHCLIISSRRRRVKEEPTRQPFLPLFPIEKVLINAPQQPTSGAFHSPTCRIYIFILFFKPCNEKVH